MSGERILIVDDHPGNLKLLSFLLDSKGYDVRTASDGPEAWQVLREFEPQLILMDLQLPGVDGFELTRQLKAHPRYGQIVIVAVTASAMKGDEQKALAAGCDGYITKPIDTKTTAATIALYLSRGSST